MVGILTRNSLGAAFDKGIDAKLVHNFLEQRLDRTKLGVADATVPSNVVDQLYHWQTERNRAQYRAVYKYFEFKTLDEFSDVQQFAKDRGFLLWSSDRTRVVICKADAHQAMKEFVQGRRTKAAGMRAVP